MIISFPVSIRNMVLHLLLDRGDIPWFTFSRQTPDTCTIDVPEFLGNWLQPKVEALQASGLTDKDGPRAWFRFQGTLISFIEDLIYRYRIFTPEMDETKEFDVRDLKKFQDRSFDVWSDKIKYIEQILKEALSSGELSLHSAFLEEGSDED